MLFFVLLSLTLSCTTARKSKDIKTNAADMNKSVTYLALGDSYTIGESVATADSYPHQISTLLEENQIGVALPKIIATTGWTTADLLTAIDSAKLTQNYSFVTLLIGVNNQYRGYDISIYQEEFISLLNKAITFANGDKNKVFVISIPDWGVTPFAKKHDKSAVQIGKEIDDYNKIAKELTVAAGVSFTNITPASKNAAKDISLLAEDGLHPSGKMYAKWADAVLPKILKTLR